MSPSTVESAKLKKAASTERKESKEPETLQEKVAQDFKKPALVEPTKKLTTDCVHYKGAEFCTYAQIKTGQKFTENKPLQVKFDGAQPEAIDGGLSYVYQVPYALKYPTSIVHACQKGRL